MSNETRFDVITLIKLHDTLQFIENGNLETAAARAVYDAIIVEVEDDRLADLLDSIKSFNPSHLEILEGLGLSGDNGSPETAALIAIYTNEVVPEPVVVEISADQIDHLNLLTHVNEEEGNAALVVETSLKLVDLSNAWATVGEENMDGHAVSCLLSSARDYVLRLNSEGRI